MNSSAPLAPGYANVYGGTVLLGGDKRRPGHLRIKPGSEVDLNERQYGWARQIHEHHPFARICSETIQSALLKDGPSFRLGSEELQAEPAFTELVRNYWRPFILDFMSEVWTRGVVAVRIVAVEGTYDYVPVVVHMGAGLRMTVYRDYRTDRKGYVVYRSFKRSTGEVMLEKVDSSIAVYSGLGADPRPDGTLTSALASFVAEDGFVRLLRTCAVSSEVKRAAPPILTETNDKSAGVAGIGADSGMRTGLYGLRDTIQKRAEDTFERNDLEVQEVQRQQRAYTQYWDATHAAEAAEAAGLPNGMATAALLNPFRSQIEGNIFPLPVNHKPVAYQLPEPRHDLLEITRVSHEILCTLYGVPLANLLGNATSNRTATGAEVSQKLYYRTLDNWRVRLDRVLTDIYHAIYSGHDRQFATQAFSLARAVPAAARKRIARVTGGDETPNSSKEEEEEEEEEEESAGDKGKGKGKAKRKRKPAPPQPTEEELAAEEGERALLYDSLPSEEAVGEAAMRVHVAFHVLPDLTYDALFTDYLSGILPWTDFAEIALRMHNLWDILSGGHGKQSAKLQHILSNDPWSVEIKLEALRQITQKGTQSLGNARDVVLSLLEQSRTRVPPKPAPPPGIETDGVPTNLKKAQYQAREAIQDAKRQKTTASSSSK